MGNESNIKHYYINIINLFIASTRQHVWMGFCGRKGLCDVTDTFHERCKTKFQEVKRNISCCIHLF